MTNTTTALTAWEAAGPISADARTALEVAQAAAPAGDEAGELEAMAVAVRHLTAEQLQAFGKLVEAVEAG